MKKRRASPRESKFVADSTTRFATEGVEGKPQKRWLVPSGEKGEKTSSRVDWDPSGFKPGPAEEPQLKGRRQTSMIPLIPCARRCRLRGAMDIISKDKSFAP